MVFSCLGSLHTTGEVFVGMCRGKGDGRKGHCYDKLSSREMGCQPQGDGGISAPLGIRSASHKVPASRSRLSPTGFVVLHAF